MDKKSIAELWNERIDREWKKIDEEKEELFEILFKDSNTD